jgi:RNA polymerase-binding transcription factor DksA
MLNLDEIKKQLEERLQLLGAKAVEIEVDLRTPRSADWEEQATEVEGDEVAGALEGSLLSEIEKIGIALKRIEQGTYAECATCGENISEQRLEALPYAKQCIDCAKRHER